MSEKVGNNQKVIKRHKKASFFMSKIKKTHQKAKS